MNDTVRRRFPLQCATKYSTRLWSLIPSVTVQAVETERGVPLNRLLSIMKTLHLMKPCSHECIVARLAGCCILMHSSLRSVTLSAVLFPVTTHDSGCRLVSESKRQSSPLENLLTVWLARFVSSGNRAPFSSWRESLVGSYLPCYCVQSRSTVTLAHVALVEHTNRTEGCSAYSTIFSSSIVCSGTVYYTIV
jgi:hypothetical protein